MKLKYYLRGLGIGIVVSTLIMGIIFSSKNNTLSDEEVMVRAAQLGMVKSSTLMDSAETLNDASTTDSTQDAATADTENTTADTDATADTENVTTDATAPDASTTNTASPEPATTDKTDTDTNATTDSATQTTPASAADPTTPTDTTTAPVITTTSETTTTVTLSIVGGDSSVGVSNKLANAGLVDSATNFDKYLCANGYDKTLRVGTYQIPVGATEEEIAKIIAN